MDGFSSCYLLDDDGEDIQKAVQSVSGCDNCFHYDVCASKPGVYKGNLERCFTVAGLAKLPDRHGAQDSTCRQALANSWPA